MRLLTFLILNVLAQASKAQYFQFSQFNYTGQRINPAMVASSDYALLNLLYRNQNTGGDMDLKSTFLSGSYPFLSSSTGRRWSGVGFSLMDDRSGNIYAIQEASLSFAVNVFISRTQTISLGMKGLYQQRKMNLEGLFTGMQYIPDRGFDENIFSGEDLQQLRNDFFTISMGMYWQQVDRNEERTAYGSLSFFDFNKPHDSFLGTESQLRTTVVGAFGFRVYESGPFTVTPEVLFTGSYSNYVVNVGTITRYAIRSTPGVDAKVDLITKYVIGRSGIVGLQFHKDNFSIGFSYDFPVIVRNIGNLGSFELGIQLRKLVDPRLKRLARTRRKIERPATPASPKETKNHPQPEPGVMKEIDPRVSQRSDSMQTVRQEKSLRQTIEGKQDSLLLNTQIGTLSRDPVELETVLLHFNFEFNSSKVDSESTDYLQDLAEVLRENKHLTVNLVGHTDNIGSDRYNLRLSLDRAEHVRRSLLEMGVDPDRIHVEGRGAREPLNENRTAEERAMNRRVELRIIYVYD